MSKEKIIIIGGVAGGASAAARLRRLNEDAEIIMLERGAYISFANCGLPYYIGGVIQNKAALTLQTPESFHGRFAVDVRINSEATAIDTENKKVSIKNVNDGTVYEETYDKLLLSMGAEPLKPPIDGINAKGVFTLRNIPDTFAIKSYAEENKAKTALVVGGGFIGIEMAENLVELGLSLTLAELSDQVMPPIDPDMAAEVHRHILSQGVDLRLEDGVKAIKETEKGLLVTLNSGEIAVDMVIMAAGVRPETTIAKAAGIALNERGAIVVDDHMRTSAQDVYAVGDGIEITDFVTGGKGYIPLAGPANKQGRIVADNMAGGDSTYKGTQGSSVAKVFDMTVASTGINEKTAKKLGLNYDKSFTYSANHAGYYPGAVNMSLKVIFEKDTGKILGAQIVGFDGVDKRCDVLATATRCGLTAYDLTELELCYAPPYGSAKDPVNMAGYVIENMLTGKSKWIHWHDVKDLPRDGSVTLIDVRTVMEYENGHIEGFANMPLDDIRNHLDEIDKEKTIYVTCQIGLRGYVAARILAQHGFDVYNLNGGYRLYNTIYGKKPLPIEKKSPEPIKEEKPSGDVISLDACGLQCPGPIVKLSAALNDAKDGDTIEISTTDPAFAADLEGFCRRTGNRFLGMESKNGVSIAQVGKGCANDCVCEMNKGGDGKNIIVFSGDLDKAIASFIIANGAAAMGRKVSMFFTFWGLNILRKPEKVSTKKDFISKMFGKMMPRGSKKLSLSKMNMAGMGAKMIRGVMKNKNVDSLEDLIALAQQNGVELIACSMSMDIMGIKKEELIDNVKLAGVAAMLANAEESDMSLFI